MSRMLDRLGRFAARRRWWVLGTWVVIAALAGTLATTLGGQLTDNFSIPGTEGQTAVDLLRERFPTLAGTDARVVFHSGEGRLDEPERQQAIKAALASVATLHAVTSVEDPFAETRPQLSPDGTIAYSTIQYSEQPGELGKEAVEDLDAAVEPARAAGIEVELGGTLPMTNDQSESGSSEIVGVVAAIVILLIAFGSAVAMGLPIVAALFSLGVGVSLITIAAALIDVPTVSIQLSMMIGLGVGIDYALFIVTRHRQNLIAGMDVIDSIGLANATAGQAVIFAGGTVVIAILGLWLAGLPAIGMMATATALVVALTVVVAITLLPALLGFAGHNVTRFGIPGLQPKDEAGERSVWRRWAEAVSRHPWRYLLSSTVALLLLATPVLSMRLGQIDAGTKPHDDTQRRAYDLLAEGFGPGFNGPLMVVADVPATTPHDEAVAVLTRLTEAAKADPDVVAAVPPQFNETGDAAVMPVVQRPSPQDQATADLVHRMRDEIVPTAVAGSDVSVYVSGTTSVFIDLSDRIGQRLPIFIAAVVLMSFVLLTVVFRSPVIALKAGVLNVLAIGASYGVVVAIFQWGWAKGIVGLEETMPIVAFIPMMMFAILFGLSMDYEVFILSRVREEYLRTGDNEASVVTGIASTARVVTSAALIMIAVFAGFALSDEPILKMMGIGLAVAVLLDATVVRIVLVPASMALLGDANWWLPRWLDRILPHLNIEGEAPAAGDGASTEPRGDRPATGPDRDPERVPIG
ncbi:MAG: MMPL family transporter [Acidimicrobiia bacterium]|nr:MMPL family transporter [Acidimicrobiia bacterium]